VDANEQLPIKVVFASPTDYETPTGGGGKPTIFEPVTEQLRIRFTDEIQSVQKIFAPSFERFPDVPAVVKVQLKQEASAKTHRPAEIFNKETCPIIGANDLGELLVSATPAGLREVQNKIRTPSNQQTEANISALASIKAYGKEDVTSGRTPEEIHKRAEKTKGKALACRLFHHPHPKANAALQRAFEEVLKENGVKKPKAVYYAENLPIYSLGHPSSKLVRAVVGFVGAQSVSEVPEYRLVRSTSRVLGNLTPEAFPGPESNTRYGLVGMIDSGTDPNNSQLQAWVESRVDWVPRAVQNNDHGSFVAGLLVHSRNLNHNDPRFPGESSRIVDVVALDRDGQISEFDLITVIDRALTEFPQVKVWNLSLSLVDVRCTDRRFSWLGVALDYRSKKHGVLFVVAAGNYETLPLRTWPVDRDLGEDDRICPPADGVRTLTVGSLAHLDNARARVRSGEPSPFSRRGPGPAYLIKPELSHYGGNCDEKGGYAQVGVISIDEKGRICENIGTSFATPLVATIAANIHDELAVDPQAVSPLLVKALLVHSAFLREVPSDADRLKYMGLGPPGDASEIISCRQSAATIILQIPVRPNPQFVKYPCPLSVALEEEGVLRGEVFMTVIHDTPLDPDFGIEYCRSNVTASLGTLGVDPESGDEAYTRQVDPVPKALTEGYESELVKHGFKWSPLKLYYRKLVRMAASKEWRLLLERLDRAEKADSKEQDVVVIITVRDPEGRTPVYDRIVQSMSRLGWTTQDLRIRSRARIKGQEV
jgi:serine protease AprX